MTTSKFKQHFEQYLLEGEAYDITHRDRYERALDDPSLLPGDGPGNPFLVAKFRAVSAHLQGLDVCMQGIEGRMYGVDRGASASQRTSDICPRQFCIQRRRGYRHEHDRVPGARTSNGSTCCC
ncbi:hypothetical protein JG688_00016362 [Phytophthora aleatoria]|uniref:Uncharacterized protein n=1 Tax=Phytophthora aleatoria TaxID=2496075 RepID=A0A8J5LW94_9STRA|nr:hypothetical protein JG688_00016362 [Phytophthora aleatoria]